jgi:hypothetical protein
MDSTQQVLLKFMEVSIERINRCLSRIYAIEQILIEKSLISQDELKNRQYDAESLPERHVGSKVLKEMLDKFNNGTQT